MSKLLAKLRSDPRVDEICVEQGMSDHRASYFVYLKLGWVLDQTGEAHCFGEDTLRDVQRTLQRVVPCECPDCIGEAKAKPAPKGESYAYLIKCGGACT